ncbi:two-component hybrid sensor and regulator [Leptolyngbya sp. NIES-3755]|nr:two-component hybrid sensor and regulator [Leptolyngbya sp. NIES-3755]
MAQQTSDSTSTKQALQHCQEQFQRSIIDAPIPMMLHAEDGEVLQISHAWTEITGYSLDEIPTIADWTEKAYGARKHQICRQIDQLYELEERVEEGEFYIQTHSGEVRVWDFYSSPLGNLPDGRRLVNSSAVDITKQKQAEVQLHQTAIDCQTQIANLEQANADLEAFSYTVAHDLSAPLRGIQGFTQALLQDDASQPLEREYLNRIATTADRMDSLICDLLILSRISRLSLGIKPINLDQIVDEVLENLANTLDPEQIEVMKPLGIVWGSRSLLVQIISNLLTNALKFVLPQKVPHIRLWAEETSSTESIRLWVEDNGIGIASEDQVRIFDCFERLHGSDFYAGTGLGLAIVRRAIDRLGGRVGVESHPGNGSQFWVELPQFIDLSEGVESRETSRANPVD